MRTQKRKRRYVGRQWVILLRPMLRFSAAREAYVLRGIGRRYGPVLRIDRRRAHVAHSVERRHLHAVDSHRARMA